MYSELQNLRQPERTSVVLWGDVVLPKAVGQADGQAFRQWIAGLLLKVSKVLVEDATVDNPNMAGRSSAEATGKFI
jgi:hypothetical protein